MYVFHAQVSIPIILTVGDIPSASITIHIHLVTNHNRRLIVTTNMIELMITKYIVHTCTCIIICTQIQLL